MKFTEEPGLIPCLSDQEVAKVMDEAGRYGKTRAHRIKWKTLMALLVNYGPRISEATSLEWKHVNFEQQTITFPTMKQFKKLPDGTSERIHRTRTLPLFPAIATLLRVHQRNVNGSPRVFPGWTTTKSGRQQAWHTFQELLKRAGVPHIRLHGLRHTAGTRFAEIDPILAQNVLGHRDLSTTTIYTHARRMAKQFSAIQPILGTRIKAPWPPEPSTEPEGAPRGGGNAPPPGAVPWGMPWADPKGEPQPGTTKLDEETQRRLDRMEAAMILLLKGLGRRSPRPHQLPEPRQLLALSAADDPPPATAEDAAPVTSESDPAPDQAILPGPETEFLDMPGLAAYSSYPEHKLRTLIHHPTHPIPHYRIGRREYIRVRRTEFDQWLEQWRERQGSTPDRDQDPEGILPAAPPQDSKPRYLLRERLAAYDLGRVRELQKVLGTSRQRAEQILNGRQSIGVALAKRIGEAVGVPFTMILEWQEESIKAAEAGTPLIPDPPLPLHRKAPSILAEKLAAYGLDNPIRLARGMGVGRARANDLLHGQRFGRCVAAKIARAIGFSTSEVFTWQGDLPVVKKRGRRRKLEAIEHPAGV